MAFRIAEMEFRMGDMVNRKEGTCNCGFCASGPFLVVGFRIQTVEVINRDGAVDCLPIFDLVVVSTQNRLGDGLW